MHLPAQQCGGRSNEQRAGSYASNMRYGQYWL
jgi:hypothetical protein